ncbi:unnamed protein product [Trifolium pratense]|uniref:Uncharacterized protein n=1 Tax=Trifolium pratense TaxID=57577 RepID=A0ACB0IML7_TRIPR|nr:unnamed protein product [Trifolium pratense]
MANQPAPLMYRPGQEGYTQRNIFKALTKRDFVPTRYADKGCLRKLGLYDSVNYMLDTLDLNFFLNQKDVGYFPLTIEFLSSLILINPDSSNGIARFRLQNKEYELTYDQIANLLRIPYGDGVMYSIPENEQWEENARLFWHSITGRRLESFEGNAASSIHNPAVRYFRQLLGYTIFGRMNSNKVNAKELFFLYAIFNNIKINSVSFMLSHMRSFVAKKGDIMFGGLITTLAKLLGHGDEFAGPLPSFYIDLNTVKSMKLIKERQSVYYLLINNEVFPNFTLPNPDRTDVRIPGNLFYDNTAEEPMTDPTPTHITDDVAAGGSHDFVPPAHTTYFSNTFAGSASSSRHYTDDERDNLLYNVHQQQAEMMGQINSMHAQQNQILQNQEQIQGRFDRWETAEAQRQQQLERVIYNLSEFRMQFDNFQRYQQPPP